jgi:peptide-methionine (S)-S-oxide reductase
MSRNTIKAFIVSLSIIGAVIGTGHVFAPEPSPISTTAPAPSTSQNDQYALATFAGGCFWCMEPPFDKLDGVISTTSGYTGGTRRTPTYEEVSAGVTGHTEAVRVVYDPKRISYASLLQIFWKNIDPTVKDRQFCDIGSQYRSGIYYHDAEQKKLAEDSRLTLEQHKPFAGKIHTEIVAATDFWPAEEYHQDYYLKNPIRYKIYRGGRGRDARLKELWGEAPH